MLTTHDLQFGDLLIKPGTREIVRGHQVIRLPKLSFEFLTLLAECAPNVVTYDMLIESVWNGRSVSAENIGQRARLLRRALNDSAEQPKYFEVVRGVGYKALVPCSKTSDETRPEQETVPSFATHRGIQPLTVISCNLTRAIEEIGGTVDRAAFHREFTGVVDAICSEFGAATTDSQDFSKTLVFGMVDTQEEDAIHAVHMALHLQQDVESLLHRYTADADLIDLQPIQIGIDLVSAQIDEAGVVNDLSASTATAQALSRISHPNGIRVTEPVAGALRGLFQLEEIALRIDQDESHYAVIGIANVDRQTIYQAPLLGRADELALLMSRWAQTLDRNAQTVLITADPGMGKTRLAAEFEKKVRESRITWHDCICSPLRSHSSLAPFLQVILSILQAKHVISADGLASWLEDAGVTDALAPAAVAPYLGIVGTQSDLLKQRSPGAIEALALTALARAIISSITHETEVGAIIFVEDLHWADPMSVKMIAHLTEAIAGTNVMLLLTSRPEHVPTWNTPAQESRINLLPLNAEQTIELIRYLAPNESSQVQQQAAELANGVPYFVEHLAELIRDGISLESSDGKVKPIDLLLAARLNKLAETRHFAQAAAVIGHHFDCETLANLINLPTSIVEQAIDRLLKSRIIKRAADGVNLFFSHVFIRNAAYDSLAKKVRHRLHLRLANLHVKANHDYELIGRHFEAAQRPETAVQYYARGGDSAFDQYAFTEADGLYTMALNLLAAQPTKSSLQTLELRLRLKRARALIYVKGGGHPDYLQNMEVAEEIANALGDSEAQCGALAGITYFLRNHNPRLAIEKSEVLLEMASQHNYKRFVVAAHSTIGNGLYFVGKFDESLSHHQKVLDSYKHQETVNSDDLAFDPLMTSIGRLSPPLWHLGRLDEVLALKEEAKATLKHSSNQEARVLAETTIAQINQYFETVVQPASDAENPFLSNRIKGYDNTMRRVGLLRRWILVGKLEEPRRYLAEVVQAYEELIANKVHPPVFVMSCGWLAETALAVQDWKTMEICLALARHVESLSEAPYWGPEISRLQAMFRAEGPQNSLTAAIELLENGLAEAGRHNDLMLGLRCAQNYFELAEDSDPLRNHYESLAAVNSSSALDLPDLVRARESLQHL
ncbi:MAG: AAA family ATPase [Pseudomonadota bacterium]